MIVGTLRMKLSIRDAHSLKEKRRVIRSLIDRMKGKFNDSVAETDMLDEWRFAEIGVAMVGNDTRFINSVLSNITAFVRCAGEAQLYDCQTEIF